MVWRLPRAPAGEILSPADIFFSYRPVGVATVDHRPPTTDDGRSTIDDGVWIISITRCAISVSISAAGESAWPSAMHPAPSRDLFERSSARAPTSRPSF